MNRTTMFCAVLSCLALANADVPQVSNVSFTQLSRSREVQVTYSLDMPAVVTLDVQTNSAADLSGAWVSIGDIHLRTANGDVNRIVTNSIGVIHWHPNRDWPEGGSLTNVRTVVTAWATNSPPDYLVIDIENPKSVRFYTSPDAFPEGNVTNDIYKTQMLVMRRVPAAGVPWQMGSPTTEWGHQAQETRHTVTLNSDYYIGIYPVTRYQHARFQSKTPDATMQTYSVDEMPYDTLRGSTSENVNWPNTDIYTVGSNSILKKIRNLLGFTFDIPTDAQWEYACRAGTGTALNIGVTPANDSEMASCRPRIAHAYGSSLNEVASPVGSNEPNNWGIYDMHGGDSFTWCRDWYVADLGSADAEDPAGPSETTGVRVLRGGNWHQSNAYLRSAYRISRAPADKWTGYGHDIGYRLWLPVTLY